MDRAAATRKALDDPRVSALHQSERIAKYGSYQVVADRARSSEDANAVLDRLVDADMAKNRNKSRAASTIDMTSHPDFTSARARDLQKLVVG